VADLDGALLRSLGIETEGRAMSTVVKRNTSIPVRKSDTFTTTVSGGRAGDADSAAGNRILRLGASLAFDNPKTRAQEDHFVLQHIPECSLSQRVGMAMGQSSSKNNVYYSGPDGRARLARS
jgi:hypothetical protein